MAGISEVGTQSFDFYEGIRIFVPATVAVALAEAVHRTLIDASSALLTDNLALAVVAALFVGLFLYFIDLPTKSIAYRTDQPADVLMPFANELGKVTTINAYFVLLDTVIPAQVRARSLYMGSIFRIGFETILLSATAALGVFNYSLYVEPPTHTRPALIGSYCHWAILVILVIMATTVLLDANRFRPGVGWGQALTRTRKRVISGVGLRGFAVMGVGIVLTCIVSVANLSARPLRISGPIVLTALWLTVYTRGSPFLGKLRRPAEGPTSVALFSVAVLSTIVSRMELNSDGSILSGRLEYGGWMFLLVIVTILLAARGHEKRLKGAYSTQRTWLTMNEAAVRKALFGEAVGMPPLSDPPKSDGPIAADGK